MATVNDLNLHLGSLGKAAEQSGSDRVEQAGTKNLGPMSASDWQTYLSQDYLNKAAGNFAEGDDMGRFDLAKALANQDLENHVSARSDNKNVPLARNDRNLRELTKHYFKQLGGSDTFDVDYQFGMYDPTLKALSDFGDIVEENIYKPIADVIDFGFDNTIGNAAGFINKDLGDTVKNFASGEDLTWIPSTVADIATWYLPGGAALKIPALLAKGVTDNSKSITQFLSGKDTSTGEDLNSVQRAINGAAGLGGTLLTALPGAGVLKGSQRKFAQDLMAKNADVAKAIESAEALESARTGFKDALKTARSNKALSESNPGLTQLIENSPELKKAKGALDEAVSARNTAKVSPEEYQEYVDATNALKQLNNSSVLPNDVAFGEFAAPGIPSRLEQAIENLNPTTRMQRMFGEGAEQAGEKAAKETAENTVTEAAEGAADEAAEAVAKEAEKPQGFLRTLLGAGKKKAGKAAETAKASVPDILRGNALMGGNALVQGAAGMGSDFEGISDLADVYPEYLATAALGFIPGMRNRNIRANKRYAPITPYSVRADMLGKMVADTYNGKNAFSDDDISVLQLLLQGMPIDKAIKTTAENKKISKAATEESTKDESKKEK